jgi:hypothetical protein
MGKSGAISLGGLEGKLAAMELTCEHCKRFGRYHTSNLIARFGRDESILNVLAELVTGCPKRDQPFNIYAQLDVPRGIPDLACRALQSQLRSLLNPCVRRLNRRASVWRPAFEAPLAAFAHRASNAPMKAVSVGNWDRMHSRSSNE